MDDYSCDDMYHDVAHAGEHAGGPALGTLSAGVVTAALVENPPAAGAETARGGVDIALAYEGGYSLGHEFGGPILGGIAYAGCLPTELGKDAGHAIAHEWNNIFHPDPHPEPEPAPTPPAGLPDLATSVPVHSSVFAAPDFSHSGIDFSHIDHFASPDVSSHSVSDFGSQASHDVGGHSHDSPGCAVVIHRTPSSRSRTHLYQLLTFAEPATASYTIWLV
jgi:hypothetical protein